MFWLASLGLAGLGCKPSPETRLKAVVGAVFIDGTGGAPVSQSVIVIAGARIRAVGPRTAVPVPASAELTDGSGRFVVPALIDLDAREDHTATSLRGLLPLSKSAEVAARDVTTLAEVEAAVRAGAKFLRGMIEDTEDWDVAFAHRLRDLRVVFAPRLALRSGRSLEVALRNTRRLHQAGVAIAVASGSTSGANTLRELELLAEAGLTPMEILVAATRHGAQAAGLSAMCGTLEVGKQANLLVLKANPLENIRHLRAIERVMRNGEWVAADNRPG
ncbi:MAG: amidohydrolase family protein [Bryobacterales bacterium]|nr:amidohydrolase family protein [Bryobacterales bacterium]